MQKLSKESHDKAIRLLARSIGGKNASDGKPDEFNAKYGRKTVTFLENMYSVRNDTVHVY